MLVKQHFKFAEIKLKIGLCKTYLPLPLHSLIRNAMFVVVKIAGQQFKVQKDQMLYVPRVTGNAGDKIEFADVLLSDNDGQLSVGSAVKAVVKAEIIGQVQGDKVIAFKMKRRKGFRKKKGHRTQFTQIKINEIA
jgi:large subunit ribosomal protein L21